MKARASTLALISHRKRPQPHPHHQLRRRFPQSFDANFESKPTAEQFRGNVFIKHKAYQPLQAPRQQRPQHSTAKTQAALGNVSCKLEHHVSSPKPRPIGACSSSELLVSSAPRNLLLLRVFKTHKYSSVPQGMVEVIVINEHEIDIFGDPTKQIFTIHHNVLAHYSLAFRRILATKPTANNMIVQSCESTFGILQSWFYTQKIEGPAGAIKLMEYAKLWKLAKDLVIDDLAKILHGRMQIAELDGDNHIVNTLEDFQTFAYMGNHRGLEEIAISKTLSAMNKHNVEQILKTMPDRMRHGFTLAMMKGCVDLTGWDVGLGFDGVALEGRHRRARRRTAKLGDKMNEALGEKIAMCSSDLSSSDGESVQFSDDELVPETELLEQEEVCQVNFSFEWLLN